ncbi:FAD-binding oxidoreductase [Rubrobacter marinus]|nr:FAD-binding oxidoreductase [Rubrobacter marinus]
MISDAKTKFEGTALGAFRAGLRGEAYAPGEEGYDGARSAWNLAVHQEPALVVMAEDAADVLAAVRFARARGLGVGVMATGHGVGAACDGGVLINTSRMRGVSVDPGSRTARVEAGAKWSDVVPEIQKFGLAGLVGSTTDVGVVGYTMGGGFGWLGRRYGLNSGTMREAEVVTATGELIRASAHENADLFWGLKGGGGNFGIVTSLELDLYPLETVYGGNLFYGLERAREVLNLYREWAETLPDEMSTAVAFLNFPPIPELPEPLRGGSFVAVRGCYCGDSPEEGEDLLRPVREGLGEPVVDAFGVMPYAAMDSISMDPVDPIGACQSAEMLRDLTPEAVDALVEVAGAGSPLIMLEIRQLGGALSRVPGHLSPLGRGEARYSMNGVGAAFSPEMVRGVRAYLARLAEETRPHQTGETYVNFMEGDDASEERVRAAYPPEDWERLVALKDRYDGENLFRFNRNIAPSPARDGEAAPGAGRRG